MDLRVGMLKNALADLVKAKGELLQGARVVAQENKRGEMVVAIILPKGDVPR